MSYKYNILWLDDKPIKALDEIREANPDIYFDKVDYMDVCKQRLESNPEKYHAVILDANGISSDAPEKDSSKSGFLTLVHTVIDIRIPLYIYSGQLDRATDGDTADMVLEALHELGLRENESIFFKSGGPYDLINRITADFDANYQYYQGHNYILDFFSKGWIDIKYKPTFDNIMIYYRNHDIDSPHGNQMRQGFEQMLEKINSIIGGITDDKQDRYSKIINGLLHKYKRYAPFMSGALWHLDEMPNEESHDALPVESRELFFDSDFSTFFLVTNWFNNLMLQFEKDGLLQQSPVSIKSTLQEDQKSKKPAPESQHEGLYEEPQHENGKTYVYIKAEVKYGEQSLRNKPGRVRVTGVRVKNKKTWETFPITEIEVEENPVVSGYPIMDLLKPAHEDKK